MCLSVAGNRCGRHCFVVRRNQRQLSGCSPNKDSVSTHQGVRCAVVKYHRTTFRWETNTAEMLKSRTISIVASSSESKTTWIQFKVSLNKKTMNLWDYNACNTPHAAARGIGRLAKIYSWKFIIFKLYPMTCSPKHWIQICLDAPFKLSWLIHYNSRTYDWNLVGHERGDTKGLARPEWIRAELKILCIRMRMLGRALHYQCVAWETG